MLLVLLDHHSAKIIYFSVISMVQTIALALFWGWLGFLLMVASYQDQRLLKSSFTSLFYFVFFPLQDFYLNFS